MCYFYYGPIDYETVWFVYGIDIPGVIMAKLCWCLRLPLIYTLLSYEANVIIESKPLEFIYKVGEDE